jgi:addiction module HigA family antidote
MDSGPAPSAQNSSQFCRDGASRNDEKLDYLAGPAIGRARNVEKLPMAVARRRLLQRLNIMAPVVHPGRVLKREMAARKLSANRLSLDIGVPSGRITEILNFRRAITADTAVRLGRYFGNSPQFWLYLQGQYDIGVVEREKGAEIARRVRPADAA